MTEAPQPRFLARTKSFTPRFRELRPTLARRFEECRDAFVVDVPRDASHTGIDPDYRFDAEEVFGRRADLVVEVGSGRGEQILAAAQDHPEKDFLAFEVWLPGVARLVAGAGELGLTNVRVIEADAALALKTAFAPGSVSEVWTFFPDPWRKTRHHKRRLVNPEFARSVTRVLQEGGVWRMATDWEDYSKGMLQVVSGAADLVNPHEEKGGFAPRFAGRVETHFEQRAKQEGRPAWDLEVRKARADLES